MSIRNRNLVWKRANDDSADDDKYIQLPKISTSSLPTAVADGSSGENEGGIVYDVTTNTVKFSNGSAWADVEGANEALSNLASVAINTSLVSDTDSTDDLGSSSIYWANAYVDKVYLNGTAALDGATAGTVNVTGTLNVPAASKLVVVGNAAGDGTDGLEIPYHATATPTGTPGTGSIFFEVDANKLWVYNGTSWVSATLA